MQNFQFRINVQNLSFGYEQHSLKFSRLKMAEDVENYQRIGVEVDKLLKPFYEQGWIHVTEWTVVLSDTETWWIDLGGFFRSKFLLDSFIVKLTNDLALKDDKPFIL